MWEPYEFAGQQWERMRCDGYHLSRVVGSNMVNVTVKTASGAYTAATAVVAGATAHEAARILVDASAQLEALGAFKF